MAKFTVNTHHAYLNNDIIIRYDGFISIEDIITGEKYDIYDEFRTHLSAGKHILKSDDHEEEIIIEDAIKLGGSTVKRDKGGFVFDDSPWVFVVLKDRLYITNIETKEERVEYGITPDFIFSLGQYNGKANDFFLFKTEDDYSLFNVQSGIITKTFTNHIFSNSLFVIYEEKERAFIFDYHNNKLLDEFIGQHSLGNCFYYVKDKKLYALNLLTSNINQIDRVGEVHESSILYKNTLLLINGDYHKQKDTFYKCYQLFELGDGVEGITHTNLLFPFFIDNWFGKNTEEFLRVKEERDAFVENNKSILSKNINQVCYGLIFNNIDVDYSKKELVLSGEIIRHPDFYGNKLKIRLKGSLGLAINFNKIRFLTEENIVNNNDRDNKEEKHDFQEGEIVIASSDSKNRFITKKGNVFYFHDFYKETHIVILEKSFDNTMYRNAYFTSDGKNVVLQINNKEAKLLGIEDFHSTNFEVDGFTVARNEGVNGYKPEITIQGGKKPVWRDPITLNIVPDDKMSSHIFMSPDGKFYAKTTMKSVLYNRMSDTEITDDEYSNLRRKYNWNSETKEEEKKSIIEVRKKLVSSSDKSFLFGKIYEINNRLFSNVDDEVERRKKQEKVNENDIERYINREANFTSLFIDRLCYVIYRENKEGAEEKQILIGRNAYFLNYVSFSYDSRYLCFAAKMKEDEFRYTQEGVFVLFNLVNEEVVNRIENYQNRQLWAVWMSLFSKNGDVAFYDSCANAYLLKKGTNYDSVLEAPGKSLLCFSPSGRYLALSDQRYIDYTHHPHENWGHQPSGNVFIHGIDKFDECLEHYNDLGEGIEGVAYRAGNVASAAFSQDEKRLLVVGNDGVVVIRNLKHTISESLEEYNQNGFDGSGCPDYPDFPNCPNEYGTHYGEYAGTYAQDVMGYSDDVINDAFDGDPEAYWDID